VVFSIALDSPGKSRHQVRKSLIASTAVHRSAVNSAFRVLNSEPAIRSTHPNIASASSRKDGVQTRNLRYLVCKFRPKSERIRPNEEPIPQTRK
jgi:hypothetical protein